MCIDCVVPSWQGDHLASIAGYPIVPQILQLASLASQSLPRLVQRKDGAFAWGASGHAFTVGTGGPLADHSVNGVGCRNIGVGKTQ